MYTYEFIPALNYWGVSCDGVLKRLFTSEVTARQYCDRNNEAKT